MYLGDDELLYCTAQPRKGNEILTQLCVPEAYTDLLIEYIHTNSGHQAIDRTYLTLRKSFTFPNAYSKTLKHIQMCNRCALIRHMKRPNVAPLRPVRVVELFEMVSVDLINYTHPTDRGNRNLFAATDNLSGFSMLAALKTASAAECLEVFMNTVVRRIACPKSVHCDRGTSWQKDFKCGLQKMGIKLLLSSSHRACSNGLIERLNRQVHQLLRAYGASHSDWDLFLPMVELTINTTPHSRIQKSPFEIVFGVQPKFGVEQLLTAADDTEKATPRFTADEKEFFESIMHRFENVRKEVRDRRARSQDIYERYYNRRHKASVVTYNVGQIVLLRKCEVRPSKFSLLYDGPFVIKKIYQSETFGQLLRLTNLKTGKDVQSLIHCDRVKSKYPDNKAQTKTNNPEKVPLVKVTGGQSSECPVMLEIQQSPVETITDSEQKVRRHVKQTATTDVMTTRQADVVTNTGATAPGEASPTKQCEDAVEIVRRRGRGRNLRYSMRFVDKRTDWLTADEAGADLVAKFERQRKPTVYRRQTVARR